MFKVDTEQNVAAHRHDEEVVSGNQMGNGIGRTAEQRKKITVKSLTKAAP